MTKSSFTFWPRAASYVMALATAGLIAGVSSAGPPTKPPPVPPSVDVAYMSISNNSVFGYWSAAAIRGIGISTAGEPTVNAELWKSTARYTPALAWDPDGQFVAWAEAIDRRGTRALMIARPGETPRVVYTFSNTGLYLTNMTDGLAWGRGCGSTSVLYFSGAVYGVSPPAIWVIDPFDASLQPREVARGPAPPPDDRGGTLNGIGVSPLGRLLVFGAYAEELQGRAAVALPLACNAGAALPEASGPTQVLFPAQFEEDKAGFQSFDWSRDGRRLAVGMGRWVPISSGSAYSYDPELWVAELNYVAAGSSELVSVATFQHITSGVAKFASWAPSVELAACDRIAFMRNGGVWLYDVPREGFTASDCTIAAPTAIGGQAVDALDWK